MRVTPNLMISVGNPLKLDVIASECPEHSESEILSALKTAAIKHKHSFGVDIFTIQYLVSEDVVHIVPGPVVGVVDCSFFKLTFTPKFTGLSVGKCLALAQIAEAVDLVNHSETIVDEEVSFDTLSNSIDYFSKAFLSSIYDVLNQGIIRERTGIYKMDPELRGDIDFQTTISNSLEFPAVHMSVPTNDVDVNRYIKGAVIEVIRHSKSLEIRGLAGELLNVFSDVSHNIPDINEFNLSSSTTLQRRDYDKCLTLAQIIYDGFYTTEGDEESFTPYFTINLDNLFERLVAQQLEKQILPSNFEVISQCEKSHPCEPKLVGKLIKPDIIVSPIDSSKGWNNIVIDSKNKYSLSESDSLTVSNSDLYQMIYYAQCFDTNYAILVYPGNQVNASKYPIQSAEGRSTYEKKRQKAFQKIKSSSNTYTNFLFNTHNIELYFWRVNLSGTTRDTEQSFAQLALFVTDLAKGELQ